MSNRLMGIIAERDAEIARLRAALLGQGRELERWKHGQQIEGDYVCPDSLALTDARKERDAARAEVERLRRELDAAHPPTELERKMDDFILRQARRVPALEAEVERLREERDAARTGEEMTLRLYREEKAHANRVATKFGDDIRSALAERNEARACEEDARADAAALRKRLGRLADHWMDGDHAMSWPVDRFANELHRALATPGEPATQTKEDKPHG